ncbi:hypothetical protein SCHPADRAFT_941523 [Schizopora paradoxa]|uniref:Uncharacterized protein n=1 Tax=Schizopora paradoxa TaxID=27342 RepID=A0A0H2RKG6_9AGAM|nr:hypothetical protein SCHPADRAFT_941523 [Schizopora paradoxa]
MDTANEHAEAERERAELAAAELAERRELEAAAFVPDASYTLQNWAFESYLSGESVTEDGHDTHLAIPDIPPPSPPPSLDDHQTETPPAIIQTRLVFGDVTGRIVNTNEGSRQQITYQNCMDIDPDLL